jgi:hypothetical protein
LIDLLRGNGPTPGIPEESIQNLTAIDFFLTLIGTFDKNVGVGFRRPLFVKRCADFDGVD